jgi:hypothetical protein
VGTPSAFAALMGSVGVTVSEVERLGMTGNVYGFAQYSLSPDALEARGLEAGLVYVEPDALLFD